MYAPFHISIFDMISFKIGIQSSTVDFGNRFANEEEEDEDGNGTYFSEDMCESWHQGSGGSNGRGGILMRR